MAIMEAVTPTWYDMNSNEVSVGVGRFAAVATCIPRGRPLDQKSAGGGFTGSLCNHRDPSTGGVVW